MADPVKTTNGTVAWLALIIAVIALIVGWVAFNRSGPDVIDTLQMQVEELEQELQEVEDDVRAGTAETLEEGADALDAGARDARTDEE
jgi:hypothetical protein